jgi:hypothetical protein
VERSEERGAVALCDSFYSDDLEWQDHWVVEQIIFELKAVSVVEQVLYYYYYFYCFFKKLSFLP